MVPTVSHAERRHPGSASIRRRCSRPNFATGLQTLRAHLLALVIGVALPLILLSLLQAGGASRQHRAAIEEGLAASARVMAIAIERDLQASTAALRALAASTDLDSENIAAFYEEARRVRDNQAWYSVWLGDSSGRQLMNLTQPYGADLPSLADREYFKAVLQTGRPVLSGLVKEPRVTDYHVAIAVPVLRGEQLKYVVVAGLKPEMLSDILEAQQRGSGNGIASILDRDHIVISRTRDSEKWIGRLAHQRYIEAIGDRRPGVARVQTVEGERVYAAFERLPETGWTVGVGVPVEEIEAPLRESLARATMLGLVFLGVAILGAIVLGRRISEPIAALAQRRRVRAGAIAPHFGPTAFRARSTFPESRGPNPGLKQEASRHGCLVHAYVLMTNHVHLLLTPEDPDALSLMMREFTATLCAAVCKLGVPAPARCGKVVTNQTWWTHKNTSSRAAGASSSTR
jgi:hypothetical protein